MIDEAFNYLLIRSLLVGYDTEGLISLVKDETDYKWIVDAISELMQKEDYILVSSALMERTSELVHHFRFEYNKNKQINDQINYIIEKLRDYRTMDIRRRIYLANNWKRGEIKARVLPKKYATDSYLFNLISLDGEYFHKMINPNEEFAIENIMEYLSLINLLLNRFPSVFEDGLFLEITKKNCEAIQSIPQLPRFYLNMLKKILHQLNEKYQVNCDTKVEVKCYLKKKESN